jgi:hypothetical protein
MDTLSWIVCRMPTNLTSPQQDEITDQIASLSVHISPIQFRHIRYSFSPAIDTPLVLRNMSLLSDLLRYQFAGIQSEKLPDAVADFVRSELTGLQPLERPAFLSYVDMCMRYRPKRPIVRTCF